MNKSTLGSLQDKLKPGKLKLMVDFEHVGQAIQAKLQVVGISRPQLAEKVGVSPQAVAKWIKTGKISRENLILVAHALHTTIDDLLASIPGRPAVPHIPTELATAWADIPEHLRYHYLIIIKDHARLYRQESTKPAIIDEYGPTKREKKGEQGKMQKS